MRLDAFAYALKAPGEKNFLNMPGTWELLERVRGLQINIRLNSFQKSMPAMGRND